MSLTQRRKDTQGYRSYPAYKDSGIAWLGEIPTHWDIRQLKRDYSVRLGKMLTPEPFSPVDTLEPYLRAANIQWNGVDTSDIKEMWFSPWEKKQYDLRSGDLLVSEGGDVGRSAIWNGEAQVCYFQNAINRVRGRSGQPTRFLFYWLYTLKHCGYIDEICSKATISHLTAEKLNRIPVPTPGLDEQRTIATFLDRETARIDALIAKKERLIALLEEKRTALISRVVTKGLDPNVQMKCSGIEWLGEIPAHWEAKRLRYITKSIQTGPFGSQLHSYDYVPEGIPVINPAHIKDGQIEPDWDCAVDHDIWQFLSRHELREGDIIFGRRGEMGRCALVTAKESGWLCGTGSMRIRPQMESVYSPLLTRILSTKGIQEWLMLESVGATMENLNTQILGRIPLAIPPIEEQRTLAAYLDRETARIDAIIARTREHISRLQERRTALISAAVTGKIDVRGEDSV